MTFSYITGSNPVHNRLTARPNTTMESYLGKQPSWEHPHPLLRDKIGNQGLEGHRFYFAPVTNFASHLQRQPTSLRSFIQQKQTKTSQDRKSKSGGATV